VNYHLFEKKDDGWLCLFCQKTVPYQFDKPESCEDCGAQWVSEKLEREKGQGRPYSILRCQAGHTFYLYPQNPYWNEECSARELVNDLLNMCQNFPRGCYNKSSWERVAKEVPELLKLALKVDELLPDGLQATARKIASIKT